MSSRIAVEGVGTVGGFGHGADSLLRALREGKPGPSTRRLPASQDSLPLHALLADDGTLEEFLSKRTLRRVDHFSRLALLGGFLALKDAGVGSADRKGLGVVVASGYGAAETTFSFLDSFMDDGDQCSSPTHFSSSVHNAAAAYLSINLGIEGPSLTVSQFEMSVASALLTARTWLADGRVGAVLFGGVDGYCDVLGYCRHRFEREGDRSCGPSGEQESAKPIVGEGAAFFVLTRDRGGPARYGFIDDVLLGGPGAAADAGAGRDPFFFLSDNLCRFRPEDYGKIIPGNAAVAAYSSVYGDIPVSQAFDLAIGAISIREGKVYPSSRLHWERPPWKVVEKSTELASRPICCLKLDGDGNLGLVSLVSA